jgi:thiol-disulfide isomerase/thioredoxin
MAKGGGLVTPMDRARYAKYMEQTRAMGSHVPIVRVPEGLSEAARYGYNFIVDGNNRGWMLDGGDEKGWVLYLDRKGDGDLSQARAERFEKVDGVYRLDVEAPDGKVVSRYRFELADGDVKIVDGTVRSGVIEIAGSRYPFRLSGSHGHYDDAYDRVSVERTPGAKADSYRPTDRYLNLGGKTYEFRVDRDGDNIRLTELTEARPDRAPLTAGSAAPEFSALSEYRGRAVLLEFWNTHCGPCREEAPKMRELYEATARGKLEFLGMSSDGDAAELRQFLDEFHLPWRQVREEFEGPVHKLYRVEAEPTYFLIGADGKILDTWLGSGSTERHVRRAVPGL